MDLGERRIRSLHLRGGDDAQLRRARYLLEEAFRTASLPGLPPNSVVLVRRLNLGSIPSGLSAPALALRIEARVRQLAAIAVCVDGCTAPKADVVWFSDPLQPCICLLQRLLDGQPAIEWYWQSLFRGQKLSLNEKSIDTLFRAARQTALNGLAAAHLIQACLESRRLARLVPLISPQLARQWLHESGVTPVVVGEGVVPAAESGQITPAEGAELPPKLEEGWLAALRQVASSWGMADGRTLWLAHQALVFSHPTYGECSDVLWRVKRWLPSWLADVSPAGEPFQTSLKERFKNRAESEDQDLQSPGQALPSSSKAARVSSERHPPEGHSLGQIAPHSAEKNLVSDKLSSSDITKARLTPLKAGTAAFGADRADASGSPDECPARSQPGLNSDFAGLGFAINVLQRCGLSELMANNERLAANDFHLYLLHAIARRFGMNKDDPLMPLFAAQEDIGAMTLGELSLPSCWLADLTYLPRDYRRLDQTASAHQLMVVMQLLMGRYLRHHCQLSLRQLICRPGRVVLSRSHWDVVFDMDQTDLRLRRLALDSDPGWVLWLGKVVQFHYDTQGYRYV